MQKKERSFCGNYTIPNNLSNSIEGKIETSLFFRFPFVHLLQGVAHG